MQKEFFLLLVSLISISLLSNIVFAQDYVLPQEVQSFLTNVLKVPSDWLAGDKILFYMILPFIAIFMIVVGFMKALRIFQGNGAIQWILSFVIAFMTFPTSVFLLFVNFMLQFSTFFAVAGFFVLFVGGIILYTGTGLRKLHWGFERAGKLKKAHGEAINGVNAEIKAIDNRIDDISNFELPDLVAKMGVPGLSVAQMNHYRAMHQNLLDERDRLTRKRRELIKQLNMIRSSKV